jgi:hypothetical protein
MKHLLSRVGLVSCLILFTTANCNNTTPETNNEAIVQETIVSETAPVAPAPVDSTTKKTQDTLLIITSMGDITVVLYNETKLHHDNFMKLVSTKYYDGILFHRVIKGFMIQTGDPNSKDNDPYNDGMGGPGYTVPAEINSMFNHKRGALAAARTENPEKASSGSQFYICHVPTPFLDGQYTVFGETIKGFEVIDKIATTPTGMNDRPNTPIKIITVVHVNAPKTTGK